LSIFI